MDSYGGDYSKAKAVMSFVQDKSLLFGHAYREDRAGRLVDHLFGHTPEKHM